ncbi:Putative transmembrane protein [hydrothermal vent metagenome]|uniref:Transmembrane protein n=1 Tax=hydrothermal vent metagenome TaxID=652676 RepID=A0A3B1BT52_9ZZZZ
METIELISLTLGIAWASGINLYAAVFMLGYLSSTGNMELPPGLEVLDDPLVMAAAGIMYCVEFFADKIPGVDTGWDSIHTFIRIPAGAVLTAGMVGGMDVTPAAEFAALLIGGGIAATSHFTKAGSRVLINTSPEPVTNWTASIAEDIAVIGGLWTALNYPVLFVALFIGFILLAIWILPRIWRAMKSLFQRIGTWMRGRRDNPDSIPPGQTRRDILKNLYHDARDNSK